MARPLIPLACLFFYPIFASADVNLRIAPLGVLFGVANVELDVPLNNQFAAGPQLGYSRQTIDRTRVQVWAFGLRGIWYFSGKVFTDSWYLSPSLAYSSINVHRDDPNYSGLEGNAGAVSASLIFGYQWNWSVINLSLGAGIAWSDIGEIDLKSDDGVVRDQYRGAGTRTNAALDALVGFKF